MGRRIRAWRSAGCAPCPLLFWRGKLQLVPLTAEELLAQNSLPSSFGAGERESAAVCQARGDTFLTNDKRARNFYRIEGIGVLDLAGVLRALWETGVLAKNKVKSLVTDIETKERLVIKDKAAIFAK